MTTLDAINRDWRWQPLRELAGGGLLLMELMLAAFWFTVITRSYVTYNPVQVLGVLGVVFAGVYLLQRTSHTWPVAFWQRSAILLIALLFSLWVTLEGLVYLPAFPSPGTIFTNLFINFVSMDIVPLEFWVLVTVLLLWWRSLALAQHPVETDQLYTSLLLGMISLLLYQFLPQWNNKSLIFVFIFVFIFVGLLSLEAIRIAVQVELRGGKEPLAVRGWLTGLGGAALGVAGLTVATAAIVRGWLGATLVRLVEILLSALLSLVLMALYPVSFLIERLIVWLQHFFTPLETNDQGSGLQPVAPWLQQQAQKGQGDVDALFRLLKSATMWTILILILAAVLASFGMKVYGEYRRKRAATEQLSPADILRDLGDAARQRARELADDLARRLRRTSAARLIQAARIRWIYGELMALCTRKKHPRQESVTPLEFLPQMVSLFPANTADLETITLAYLSVRYAEIPESSQEIRAVVEAWEHIKALDT